MAGSSNAPTYNSKQWTTDMKLRETHDEEFIKKQYFSTIQKDVKK